MCNQLSGLVLKSLKLKWSRSKSEKIAWAQAKILTSLLSVDCPNFFLYLVLGQANITAMQAGLGLKNLIHVYSRMFQENKQGQ